MKYDLSTDKVQYVVACSHLDTQWLWTIQETIDEYLPATMLDNFALFEHFPGYVLSFEGAYRYMLMKKHYPREYAKVKHYAAKGNWVPVGSMVDMPDVNLPCPESLIRQILYGNLFFEREFGSRHIDIFLPDCFGFSFVLPTIGAHCGLKGFSTQKLTSWRGGTYTDKTGDVQVGIPFNIGVWEGVDGGALVAAINPGSYMGAHAARVDRIDQLGQQCGVWTDYHYVGVGDRGGACSDEKVQTLMDRVAASADEDIKVINAPADQMFRDLTPEQIERLPHYRGELLCTQASGGFYTAQAAMKRWNRTCEQIADAAERIRVTADWLKKLSYPREALAEAWVRFLWHQMHDDLTGTSIPAVYKYSARDFESAHSDFQAMAHAGMKAVCQEMDTQSEGTPCVVFNPLSIDREDTVCVSVPCKDRLAAPVRVFGPDGVEVPSEITQDSASARTVRFLAQVPSAGCAVFDIRESETGCLMQTGLSADDFGLENANYKVRIDENGDICSMVDKVANKELLSAPVRLELLDDFSPRSPAWDIRWEDLAAPPREYVGGPVKTTVLSQGPLCACLRIERTLGTSRFVQVLRLAAGAAGDRLEIETTIAWQTHERLLKASFPLSVCNAKATYDIGVGVVERGTNSSKMNEVPAQQWAEIVDSTDHYGVAILNDCKYGWDKPADNRLRLTLLHTPRTADAHPEQGELEIGQKHHIVYAITGHTGVGHQSTICSRAARLNQPLECIRTGKHTGRLGKTFSFLRADTPQVMVMAVKKAERSEQIIVRVRELDGRQAVGAKITFAVPITEAVEVDGQEMSRGKVHYDGAGLKFDLGPYQPKAFAVELANPFQGKDA